MGTCKSCRYAAPDTQAFRCVHPEYRWTFRAGPSYGCTRYEPLQPRVALGPHPRQSSDALASRIRELLGGPHYQMDLTTRRRVQELSAMWRKAMVLESSTADD